MKAFNKDKTLRKLKLKQNKNKYIKYGTIGLSCLVLVIAIIMFTFAYFESKVDYTLIKGRVSEPLKDLNIIAIYQGDTKVDNIPAKNSGWYFDRAECTNGATASWDYGKWGLLITSTSKTKCSLYFLYSEKPYRIVSGNLNTVGSVVKIADEEFYVIGQEDSTHVKLLSKWNLNVGSNAKETAIGLQDSDVRGYRQDGGTKYGTVVFSSTKYWVDSSNNLKTTYGSSYPAYVYDNNASIKTYVDTYVTYLTQQGVNVSGRLISHEELVSLGCNASSRDCQSAPSWVYQTIYWSGSACDLNSVWFVTSRGYFNHSLYDDDYYYGVRPVIILEK